MNTANLRCWAEVSAAALVHNVTALRNAGKGKLALLAVVKANAYGHGLPEVVPILCPHVEMFGVANIEEASVAKKLAPTLPTLILSPMLAGEREEALREGFIPWISSLEEASAFDATASKLGINASVHLKIDTGMGRIGIQPELARDFIQSTLQMPNLIIDGIGTHFPVADEDREFTERQSVSFRELLSSIPNFKPRWVHIQNGAGVLGYEFSGTNLARVGLPVYGISPLPEYQPALRPALTWKARVTLCKTLPPDHGVSYGRTYVTTAPTRIATISVGYADGYQRHLSNKGADVLIHGKRCAVLGRVTMDQIIVDVTNLHEVEAGDEVILLGSEGEASITAADLAKLSGTIPWEIFTGLGSRVKRVLAT